MSTLAALASWSHSFWVEMRPVRRRELSTRAVEQRRRCTSCSRDISREKKATLRWAEEILMFLAMFNTKAVLPMDGRAATMMKSPFWKPLVRASREGKPLARPVMDSLFLNFRVISWSSDCTASPIGVKSERLSSRVTSRMDFSASSVISATSCRSE